MTVKYQINFKDGTLIGRPYKSKARARTRVDTLDNQYGAYAHYIKPVCDHNLSPEMIADHNVTACDTCYVPADILKVSTGSTWAGG